MKKLLIIAFCLLFCTIPNNVSADDITFTGSVEMREISEGIEIIMPDEDDAFYHQDKPTFRVNCVYENPIVSYYDTDQNKEVSCTYLVGLGTVDIEISRSGKYIIRNNTSIQKDIASSNKNKVKKYVAPKTGIE